MGTIFVDNLEPQSGTSLTLGASGDTVTLTSGAKTSGFGKVGQVVTGTYTTDSNTSSSSFVDTGAGVFSITPSTTSSKILVDFGCSPHVNTGSASNNVLRGIFTIYRDINGGGYSNLATSTGIAINRVGDSFPSNNNTQDVTLRVIIADTPNTTSQVNYKLYYKTTAGSVYLNLYGNTHTVKLTEILD
tara:strand:- start:51 stop:614 length:564 start_codon:yes stop_codon:yes gene_type:complete